MLQHHQVPSRISFHVRLKRVDDRKDIGLTLGGFGSAKGRIGSLISEKILKLKGLLSLTDDCQEVHSY